jgi:hypothetical protein
MRHHMRGLNIGQDQSAHLMPFEPDRAQKLQWNDPEYQQPQYQQPRRLRFEHRNGGHCILVVWRNQP